MKRHLWTLAALLPMALVGCGDGTTDTAEGEAGKKLTITVPSRTEIRQGATVTFSVGIRQENLTEPIRLSFEGLPEGVSLEEKSLTVDLGVSETVCTLHAAANAPPIKEHKVAVTATSGALTAGPVQLRLVVQESLETKQVRKKEYEAQVHQRLKEVDVKLARLLEAVKNAPAEKRTEYLEGMTDLHEERARVQDKVKELEKSPVESWENPRDVVEAQLKDLEKNVDGALSKVSK